MKDTKYKILAYFDNQSYRKLFNEVNSDYAENLQILLHNLSLFSYDVLIIGVILYKENISNTAKEYQLVELLAKYPDKVFSKQNLYESIWQEPFARDNDVINTHISNLRKKLKGEGCRIKTIWGLGYRFAK